MLHAPPACRQAGRHPGEIVILLLKRRIQLVLSLPIDKLERLALQNELRNIGTRKDLA
jgi:hypothetical protein